MDTFNNLSESQALCQEEEASLKVTYGIILFICHSRKDKRTKQRTKHWLPGVRNESMLGVRNVTKDVLSWREFGDDVIVLYLDCGGGYTY